MRWLLLEYFATTLGRGNKTKPWNHESPLLIRRRLPFSIFFFLTSSLPDNIALSKKQSLVFEHIQVQYPVKMQSAVLLLAVAGAASAQLATTKEPSLSDIKAAAATAVPSSPVSNVEGVAFKHFYQVWLENIVSQFSPSPVGRSKGDTLIDMTVGFQQCFR